MKINAEIEIDWISERGVDEAVADKLQKALVEKISERLAAGIGERIAESAEQLCRAKTELLINTALENPILVNQGWNRSTKYESVYDMVEQKMTALYEGKLNTDGQCKKDPLLANIEASVKSSTQKLLTDVERIVKKTADASAKEAVKNSDLMKALEGVVKIN